MFILNVLFNKYMWIARTSSQDVEYFHFLRKGTFVIFPLITDNFFELHKGNCDDSEISILECSLASGSWHA